MPKSFKTFSNSTRENLKAIDQANANVYNPCD